MRQSLGDTLRAGDYFEMQLPDKFKFPENALYCNFNLYTKDGNILAKGLVSPANPGGGKVRITFTDYVNDKHHIKGNFNLTANWNKVSYPRWVCKNCNRAGIQVSAGCI